MSAPSCLIEHQKVFGQHRSHTHFGAMQRNILNEARFVETEISSLVEGHYGNVRFGVGLAWSLTVFPTLLSEFCSRFPQIDVEVETGVADHLMPRLVDGEIDFWLGSLHGIEETDDVITRKGGPLRTSCLLPQIPFRLQIGNTFQPPIWLTSVGRPLSMTRSEWKNSGNISTNGNSVNREWDFVWDQW